MSDDLSVNLNVLLMRHNVDKINNALSGGRYPALAITRHPRRHQVYSQVQRERHEPFGNTYPIRGTHIPSQ